MTDKDFQIFMIQHMTKLTDDVTDLRQNMVRMEFQLTEKINILFDGQASIIGKLDEHSAILDNHSAILDRHTAILDNHSAILDNHTAILDNHTAILDNHTAILNNHSAILNNHSAILDKHSAILDDHTKRLQRIEDKVEHHDIQIRVLDETKSNKRKSKA